MDEATSSEQTQSRNKFDVFYEKSLGYRSIHSDGFVVSPNAKGAIAITFYSERLAIPKHVRIDLGPADAPVEFAEEEIVEGKSGVVRYMEATAFIDAETAEELRDWLARAIRAVSGSDEDDASTGKGA